MNRIFALTFLTAACIGVESASAGPCVDVNAAFDPSSAKTLDRVTFSGSLANTGDQDGLIIVRVTVAFNDSSFGPLEGKIYLTAGRELAGQIPFLVRPIFPSGTLTITIEAQVGECTDTAVATLVIEATDGPPLDAAELETFASSILATYGLAPTPTQPVTWGTLKTLYRE